MKKPPLPETPGAVRAKLVHMRNKKAALDELILCMERYKVYQLPVARKRPGRFKSSPSDRRLAGAA